MKGQYRGFASGNLAPTCLLPRPAACSNPTGICTIGYIFLCGPLRARAPCFSVYSSLSSFLRIFFHGVIARRPGYVDDRWSLVRVRVRVRTLVPWFPVLLQLS